MSSQCLFFYPQIKIPLNRQLTEIRDLLTVRHDSGKQKQNEIDGRESDRFRNQLHPVMSGEQLCHEVMLFNERTCALCTR